MATSPKGHIIYIEDDPVLIDLVTMILKYDQYEVHGAFTVENGIDLINKLQPDLILLDIMLPDADGWEIQKYVQATPALTNIPIIIVSAKNRPVDVAYGAHVLKASRYLTKPFLPDELRNAVVEALA